MYIQLNMFGPMAKSTLVILKNSLAIYPSLTKWC